MLQRIRRKGLTYCINTCQKLSRNTILLVREAGLRVDIHMHLLHTNTKLLCISCGGKYVIVIKINQTNTLMSTT
jgi:hypothetical protein